MPEPPGLPIFVVDAFTDAPFTGNPAAVCVLGGPAPEDWMQSLAAEMRHSETAFVHPLNDGFDLRWFTPAIEVDLCGHATLASAHVLWETGRVAPERQIAFSTRSGVLRTRRGGGEIVLDLPATPTVPAAAPEGLLAALGVPAQTVERSRFDYLIELASPEAVRAAAPDMAALARVETRGVIVTARGGERGVDFSSRFFGPAAGIDEDPVTGSAHCALGPFWQRRLGRDEMVGHQVSARGGRVRTRIRGARVELGGTAVTVIAGHLREGPPRRSVRGRATPTPGGQATDAPSSARRAPTWRCDGQ